MSRSLHRIVLVLAAGVLGLALAACGSEQESSTPSQGAATTVSENPSASVVGGPKPASPTTSVADDHAGHTECGTTKGPDGALRIIVLEGALDCATAEQVATHYGPKIATGQPQQVSGWDCGPSETAGILAACSKDDQEFGLAP
ncbi:ABC transporter substrate-binding protein [Gordonia insulae]|uniref:DUF732 domain-containing protein n=1 Tax=Gordonia insulae TaxID=2420509 RepID=A0A3G8JP42_9ACTN|nr:hypothetical protein [Gordonia insulae]AZG46718.1 hypothetical protein D7316_03319 [Gordonia insulae]